MKNTPDPAQGELFVCDIANWPVKDDIASMEVPIFSLAKQKDTKTREYRRGAKVVRVIPRGPVIFCSTSSVIRFFTWSRNA